MTDNARELIDLKREVVEARNQVIKTDNQVKNLTLDIKGFEQRFDGLESRVRLSSVGVNLIVALTIAAAAWFVGNVRTRAYESEVARLNDAVHDEHLAAQAKTEALVKKLAATEAAQQARETAAAAAIKVLALLDDHDDKAAGEALGQIDLAPLSPLERRACERRFDELRQRQAVALWRVGRQAMLQARPDEAVAPLRRVVALDGNGRFAGPAREQLCWALWQSRRYQEAEAVLRPWAEKATGSDADDARYLLGTTLLRLNKRDEGRGLLQGLLAGDSRFVPAVKAYLQALDAGTELPDDLPGGRVRVSRRLPGPQQAPASAPARPAAPQVQPAQELAPGSPAAPNEGSTAAPAPPAG